MPSSDEEAEAMMEEGGSPRSGQQRQQQRPQRQHHQQQQQHLLDSDDEEEEEQSAFPIGAGRAYFLFTVDIVGWGGDGHGLQLPEPGAGGMWLSYILFKSVACTDRFYELGGDNDTSPVPSTAAPKEEQQQQQQQQQQRQRRSTDMFRLRSAADGADLAAWFAGAPLTGEGAGGGGGGDPNRRWLQIFLCAPQRFVAVARLDLWQLLMEGRRPGEVGRGFFPHEVIGRFEMEAWEEDGPSGVAGGAWVDVRLRIEREEESGGGLAAEEEGVEMSSDRPSIAVGNVTIPIDANGDEDDEEMGGGGGRQQLPVPVDDEEEEEEEGEETRRPPGLRSFRLSMDLRAVRGLPRAQRLFLYHHYPHLSEADPRVALRNSATTAASASSSSVGPGPVVTEPVWVPARGEGPMSNGCCSFSFRGTYALLAEIAAAHPFRVALKALPAGRDALGGGSGGGGAVEVGQAVLPLSELLEDAPVTYRSGVRPKLFRTHAACCRYLDRMGSKEERPIIMRVLDAYVPAVLRDGSGGGGGAAVRAVLVLEDLGPAGDGVDEDDWDDHQASAASASVSPPPQVRAAAAAPLLQPLPVGGGPVAEAAGQQQQQQQQQQQGYPELSVALTLLDVERKKLEFEDWRHKREVEWSDRLRAKEARRMQQLEGAYEAREAERKERFQQVQEELARLEAQLRSSLAEVEARERRVAAEEAALELQASKQAEEAQALQRRLREEARYQGERDRRRAQEQEARATRLEKQLELAEKRVQEAQEDFARFRREQRRQTPAALQAEVVRLTKERAELEARCERERAEKVQAQLEKEQYRTALQRTARALKREQARKLGDLRGQLEQLRLEYMAREERYRSCGDREELHAIKRTLDALQHFRGPNSNEEGQPQPPSAGAVVQEGKENLMAASSSVEGGIGINDGAGGGGGGGGRRFLRPVPPPASKGGAGGGGGNGPQRRGLFTVLTKQRRHGDELEDEEEEDQATLPNPRLHAAAAADGEVGRLRRERESLLVSGNYGEADPIVEAVGEGGGVGVPGGVASQTSTITFSEERGASV